jgi:peptidoglycan hydrolase-like protein with peptidoglycan-binding domain
MDQMVLATQTWLNTTYNGVNGYTPFSEEELDGVTGNQTYKRLIQALQIELNTQYNAGISVDGSFGNGTLNAIPATISKNTSVNNITFIIQGSLWCKGYSAGVLDGIFDSAVESAVKNSKPMPVLLLMEESDLIFYKEL